MDCVIDGTVSEKYLSLGIWGKPVISYPIKSALESGVFDRIIVATESSYVKYLVKELFESTVEIVNKIPTSGLKIDGRAANILPYTIRKIVNEINMDVLENENIMQFIQNEEESVLVNCSNNFELTLVLWKKREKGIWLKKMITNRINEKRQVLANSITKDEVCLIGHSQWDQWTGKLLCGYPIRNCGISGITIKEYINEIITPGIIKLSCGGIILILLGINDLIPNVDVSKVVNELLLLLKLIYFKTNAKIFVVQTLHTNGRLDRNNSVISQYNERIYENLPDYAKWINTDKMNDAYGNLNYHFTTDGLHLNAKGYAELINVLENALREGNGKQL